MHQHIPYTEKHAGDLGSAEQCAGSFENETNASLYDCYKHCTLPRPIQEMSSLLRGALEILFELTASTALICAPVVTSTASATPAPFSL